MGVLGRIHSLESFGAVDGPGIRFVIFFKGCTLRCIYCHNPDSWSFEGERVDSDVILEQVRGSKSFISKGGVTLSGGEPLLQPEFAVALLEGCKAEGLHRAIDTSGGGPLENAKKVFPHCDMVLLDIKSAVKEMAFTVTGSLNHGYLANALATLELCEKLGRAVWIRHVLVPGYTLDTAALKILADTLKPYRMIQRVDLLPYHDMGLYKWRELGVKCPIESCKPPEKAAVEEAKNLFRERGFCCP